MANRSRPQPKNQAALDESAFLRIVKREIKRGQSMAAAAAAALKFDLEPAFAAELLQRGAASLVGEKMGRLPRERILRREVQIMRIQGSEPKVRTIEVTRSPLRDWPIRCVDGVQRQLEESTVEDVVAEIKHLDGVISGLNRRRRPLDAVRREAVAAGVQKIGELPDDVLERCLQEA